MKWYWVQEWMVPYLFCCICAWCIWLMCAKIPSWSLLSGQIQTFKLQNQVYKCCWLEEYTVETIITMYFVVWKHVFFDNIQFLDIRVVNPVSCEWMNHKFPRPRVLTDRFGEHMVWHPGILWYACWTFANQSQCGIRCQCEYDSYIFMS